MKRAIVVLLALALVPTVASAGTITEHWNYGPNVNIVLAGYGYNPIRTATGYATITTSGVSGLADGSYEAYCVDILHWSNDSSGVGAVTAGLLGWNLYEPPTATARAAAASWLLNTYLGQIGTDKSALQIAIWEVLYETNRPADSTINPWATGSGNILFSSNTANATAQVYLNHAFADGATAYAGNAVWIQTDNSGTEPNAYYQDFATTVPEPGSMLLLGSGMIGLAVVMRRRPKK